MAADELASSAERSSPKAYRYIGQFRVMIEQQLRFQPCRTTPISMGDEESVAENVDKTGKPPELEDDDPNLAQRMVEPAIVDDTDVFEQMDENGDVVEPD